MAIDPGTLAGWLTTATILGGTVWRWTAVAVKLNRERHNVIGEVRALLDAVAGLDRRLAAIEANTGPRLRRPVTPRAAPPAAGPPGTSGEEDR